METENKEGEPVEKQDLQIGKRAERAFGPVFAGLVLDVIDVASFGPLGLLIGPFIGFPAGYWVGGIYGFSKPVRVLWGILAAIYCMIPFTEVLPLATLTGVCARFFEKPPPEPEKESEGEKE